MKIIEYSFIGADWEDFSILVNIRIKEGWQPFGAICVVYRPPNYERLHFQAMVKYEEDK